MLDTIRCLWVSSFLSLALQLGSCDEPPFDKETQSYPSTAICSIKYFSNTTGEVVYERKRWYDSNLRLVRTEDFQSSDEEREPNKVFLYEYTDQGQLAKETLYFTVWGDISTELSQDEKTVRTYEYNANGELIRADYRGSLPPTSCQYVHKNKSIEIYCHMTRDNEEFIKRPTRFYTLNDEGQVIFEREEGNISSRFIYNDDGQLVESWHDTLDAGFEGIRTQYEYNKRGQIALVIRGGIPSEENPEGTVGDTHAYSYDSDGLLTEIEFADYRDQTGHTGIKRVKAHFQYRYDEHSRLSALVIEEPDIEAISKYEYGYDCEGGGEPQRREICALSTQPKCLDAVWPNENCVCDRPFVFVPALEQLDSVLPP